MEYPKFKVHVLCCTFNQSQYITDALNGFVMQQTDFPFVCSIIDDASTDGEQDLIREYVEDNFDLSDGSCHFERETDYAFITYAQHKMNKNCYFAVLYLKENHYSIKKPKMPYLSEWRDLCEYEALCEGDDYWIVSNKLKKQVKCLNMESDAGMCYTRTNVLVENTGSIAKMNISKRYHGINDLIVKNSIATLTVMYRVSLYKKYDEEIRPNTKNWAMGDWPAWIWFEINSRIIFIDATTSMYRLLENSASHFPEIDKQKDFVDSAREMTLYFLYSYKLPMALKEKIDDEYYRSCAHLFCSKIHRQSYVEYLSKVCNKTTKENLKLILSNLGIYPWHS